MNQIVVSPNVIGVIEVQDGPDVTVEVPSSTVIEVQPDTSGLPARIHDDAVAQDSTWSSSHISGAITAAVTAAATADHAEDAAAIAAAVASSSAADLTAAQGLVDELEAKVAPYLHIQGQASTLWDVTYPISLGNYPSVVVVDSAGTTVVGDVDYVDLGNLTIAFTVAFSGWAEIR